MQKRRMTQTGGGPGAPLPPLPENLHALRDMLAEKPNIDGIQGLRNYCIFLHLSTSPKPPKYSEEGQYPQYGTANADEAEASVLSEDAHSNVVSNDESEIVESQV